MTMFMSGPGGSSAGQNKIGSAVAIADIVPLPQHGLEAIPGMAGYRKIPRATPTGRCWPTAASVSGFLNGGF